MFRTEAAREVEKGQQRGQPSRKRGIRGLLHRQMLEQDIESTPVGAAGD